MSIVEVPRPRDSDVARRIETDGESFTILYFNTQQSLFANRQFSRFLLQRGGHWPATHAVPNRERLRDFLVRLC